MIIWSCEWGDKTTKVLHLVSLEEHLELRTSHGHFEEISNIIACCSFKNFISFFLLYIAMFASYMCLFASYILGQLRSYAVFRSC